MPKGNKKKGRARKGKRGGRSGFRMSPLKKFSSTETPGLTFLDPHKFLVFKYEEIISQSLATVTATNQVFNLNSLFDPNRTGTGHQPYGFDQLAAIYNRYRVWETRWKVTFHAESQGFYVLSVPSNGALATSIVDGSSFQSAGEIRGAVTKSQGTGANSVFLRGRMKLNNLNGTTPTEYEGDDRFQALTSSSPSELLLLNIGTYNPSGSTTAIDFVVELWFYVELHDPFILGSSFMDRATKLSSHISSYYTRKAELISYGYLTEALDYISSELLKGRVLNLIDLKYEEFLSQSQMISLTYKMACS